MPNEIQAYRRGPSAFEFKGTTGFMITYDITSKDIKDHTIKGKDIRPGTVKKLKGQPGPQGPQGPAGNGESVVSAAGGSTGGAHS